MSSVVVCRARHLRGQLGAVRNGGVPVFVSVAARGERFVVCCAGRLLFVKVLTIVY